LLIFFLTDQEFTAFETNTSKHLENGAQILYVKYRPRQFNVTEITGSLHIIETICWTNETWFKDTHSGVKQTTDNGFIVDIGISGSNFGDRTFANFIRGKNTKLYSNYF
jgi:hypothetical protein